jgi:hypothetical protein
MKDMQLEDLLREMHTRGLTRLPKRHRDMTPDCPPLPRFRELVYRPSTQTDSEREHMPGCRYCRMTLELCRREQYHPDVGALFARLRGATALELAAITIHLDRDQCERCRAVLAVLALLVARQGVAWVEQRHRHLACGALRLARAGRFDTEVRQRHYQEVAGGDDPVIWTLRETDARDLVLSAETQDREAAQKLRRFEILGEGDRQLRVGFAVLAPWGDGTRWFAEITLGPFADLAREARDELRLAAYPIEPEELTETDPAALLWSVEAMEGTGRAFAAWEAWLDRAIARAAVPALVALLSDVKTHLDQVRAERGPFCS